MLFRSSVTVGGKDIFGIAPVAQNQGARPTCGRDPAFNAACAGLGIPNGTRVGVNPWTTAPVFRVDMRVARPISLSRGMEVQPSIEVFNVFDRANFANPVATLPNALPSTALTEANRVQPGQAFTSAAAGTFGTLTSTVGRTVGLGTNRQVQLAFRLNF